nr:protein ALP1-like [Ipomoea batatas]
MVATFLLTVGQNSRYCHTRETFYRSHFATSKNFNKVLKALNTIAPEMMVKPSFIVPTRIRESTRFYPYFKDCVGAIDGTHIPAMVTGRDVSSYLGGRGSAHDSKLLSDSLSRRNGLKVPQAPYRGVRYHLQDFVGQGRDPENDVELFNLRHASLRNVIERIFGIFKSRFTIFKSAPLFPYKTQAELVLACAGLHNFLRKECRSDEFPIELDSDDSPSPLPMNDIDNFEQLFETQEQQREHANEWRAKIALDMWRDTQQGETNANQR